MPKIGMGGSTVMLMPWMDALKAAVENEFEAFEIFAEFPQCVCEQADAKEKKDARALVDSSGIALAVHAPFNSLNIAALNPGIRAESVSQTLAAVDFCADLGGRTVVVHNGTYVTSERMRKNMPEAGRIQWDYNIESLKQIARRAGDRGVWVCLENIGFELVHMDRNVDDLLAIQEEVGEPRLFFCLDIGHARLNNELGYAIDKLGPDIRHIHFTDNFGEQDDHLVIGKGNFDYTPHLDFFRNFGHIITLEVVIVGEDVAPAIKSRENVMRILEP